MAHKPKLNSVERDLLENAKHVASCHAAIELAQKFIKGRKPLTEKKKNSDQKEFKLE